MMDVRSFDVIDSLYREKGYLDGDELASSLDISTRTLRDIIKDVREHIEQYGATISYKNNFGYRLEVHQKTLFESFLAQEKKNIENMRFDYPVTSDERCDYIIRRFLLSSTPVKSDDLCEELGISKTTFAQDLRHVRQILSRYELQVEVKSKKGLAVCGSEKNMQSCMADFVFYNDFASSASFTTHSIGQFCRQYEQKIRTCVNRVLSDNDYHMTDLGINNLVVHILITLYRGQMDPSKPDLSDVKINEDEYRLEISMAQQMADLVADYTGMTLLEEELGFIAVHIIGSRLFSREDENLISMETLNLVRDLFEEIRRHYGISFFDDMELFALMCMHMEPMIQRVRNGIPMRNPLLDTIKSENPNGYDLAVYACRWLSQRLNASIDENEMGYMALHFGIALDGMKKPGQKRVLAVCASGVGTSRMLKYNLEKLFGNSVESITTARMSEVTQMDLSEYDLIVTTVPFDYPVSTRVIQVGCYLSQSDQDALRSAFTASSDNADQLIRAFDPAMYIENGDAETWQQAVEQLCKGMSSCINIPDDFLKLTMDREMLSSTYIGNRCAVPHPTSVLLEENRIAVMHLKKPVVWSNGKRVEWVFLIGMKRYEDAGSDRLIHALYELIGDGNALRQLKLDPSYDHFIRILQSVLSVQSEAEDDFFR